MKTIQTLAAGALALAFASAAFAQDVIHITGSTAFRGATIAAIESELSNANTTPIKVAYIPGAGISSELNASVVIISGTPSDTGTLTYVKCYWTGSVSGITALVYNVNEANAWLANSVLTNAANSTISSFGATSAKASSPLLVDGLAGDPSPSYDAAAPADIAMADCHQASTGYANPQLTENQVGVIAFEWVANNGSPSTLLNMTDKGAEQLLSGGTELFQFTGVPTDTSVVRIVGRNFDSGTRLSTMAETGFGIFHNPVQYAPVLDTSTTSSPTYGLITALTKYPTDTLFAGTPAQTSYGVGASGYNGGGSVANALAAPNSLGQDTTANGSSYSGAIASTGTNSGPAILVGYLSRGDATTAMKLATNLASTAGAASNVSPYNTNTAHRLTWNGVADWSGANNQTVNSSFDQVIENGQYSFWEYEWLDYSTNLSGDALTVAGDLANLITNTTAAVSGVNVNLMNVSRPVEGGIISP
jgi:hypothetical protein